MRVVYLLHFERPYHHAQHYVGFSKQLEKRLELHREGKSQVPLMRAIAQAGIGFEVARLWPGKGRLFERKLKKMQSRKLCPICNPTSAQFRGRSEEPFRHRKRRRVRFTQAELKAMRRGYREGKKGLEPRPGKLYGAYMRGYRKGASAVAPSSDGSAPARPLARASADAGRGGGHRQPAALTRL